MPLVATTDTVLESLAGHPHDCTAAQVTHLVDPYDPGAVGLCLDLLTQDGLLQRVGPHYALTTRGWRSIRTQGLLQDTGSWG